MKAFGGATAEGCMLAHGVIGSVIHHAPSLLPQCRPGNPYRIHTGAADGPIAPLKWPEILTVNPSAS
jgi:hypothetical protein